MIGARWFEGDESQMKGGLICFSRVLAQSHLRSDDDHLWRKKGENLVTKIHIFEHFEKYNPFLRTRE